MCVIFLESMDSNFPRVKNRHYELSDLNNLLYTAYTRWSRVTCLLEQGALKRRLLRGVWVCVCWTISSVEMVVLSFNHFRRHYRVDKVERLVRCCWDFSIIATHRVFCTTIYIPINTFTAILIGLSEVSYL